MSDTYQILEEIRRDMMDVARERIQEHGLKVVSSEVGIHRKYGTQLVIIIQPADQAE